MTAVQTVFKRYEQKYLLSETQTQLLRARLNPYMAVDQYGETTICSLYLDTSDDRLVRASLEKPVYKEKLRLRCYGIPQEESPAFLEIKKKYRGIVYKRRVGSTYRHAVDYLSGAVPLAENTQIVREIEWFRQFYGTLEPKVVLCYDRTALFCKEDLNLRMTLDRNIRWRAEQLNLTAGAWGEQLLLPGQHLLEIKIAQAMPLWLCNILSELQIYPTGFSKYGKAYLTQQGRKTNILNGGIHCA